MWFRSYSETLNHDILLVHFFGCVFSEHKSRRNAMGNAPSLIAKPGSVHHSTSLLE